MGVEGMNNHFAHWDQVPRGQWPWIYFTPAEMACRKTSKIFFVPEFMDLLTKLRIELGFALPVTSGYRSPEHDRSIGGANVHPSGEAVDINVWGERYWTVLRYAPALGFTGIGSKQKGLYKGRFIHLDTLQGDVHPRPWGWTY